MASLKRMGEGKSVLILVLLVAIVYLPSLPGDFHFDDYLLLLDNPDVNAPDFRFASFLDHYGGRPLTLLTFHWNYRLSGRDPASYVALNLGLHLLACLLLFGWIRGLTGRPDVAFATALLFGIHPLQTQSVNYIWSRSMLLMAVFALAALWLTPAQEGTGDGTSPHRPARTWLALGLFQLAIWSRTEAMAVAPFLVARGIRPAAVAGLVSLNLAGFLVGMFHHAPANTALMHSDIAGYWLTQPAALLKYLSLMVVPIGLSIDHDFRPSVWICGLSGLFLALLILLVFRRSQHSSEYRWAMLWILLLFLPSALIPNEDPLNESRAYLAMAGFAFLVSNRFLRGGRIALRAPPVKWAALLVLLVLAAGSAVRNHQWNDNLSLWQSAARRYPDKLRIQYNLGHAYLLEDRLEPAEAAFRRALGLNPGDDLSYAALGYCAEVKGDWPAAQAHYRQAFELNPANGYAARGLERAEREILTEVPRPPEEKR